MLKKPKIFITGGHLTPAIAITDLLLKKNWQVFYIGRVYAQEEDRAVSVEYETLKNYRKKLKLLLITTGKIQQYLSWRSLISFLKIPFGFLQSLYWMIKYKPDIVLSFGGYLAVPVAFSAWFFNIPVVTHEQTYAPGLANRLIAGLSSKVCLTWSRTQKYFPKDKTVITGLPLRREIKQVKKKLPVRLDKPLIYISGGSLGSHRINELFMPIISKLINDFSIIHQCGSTEKYSDYDKLIEIKNRLPDKLKHNYLPIKYIKIDYLGWVYQKAAFSISRSGANTVYEFAIVSLPAIFIPIPWARNNEQYLNAELFVKNGCGLILDQDKISSEQLYQEILLFNKNLDLLRKNMGLLKKSLITDGTNNLLKVLELEMNEKNKDHH